jgi:hypothetical protein
MEEVGASIPSFAPWQAPFVWNPLDETEGFVHAHDSQIHYFRWRRGLTRSFIRLRKNGTSSPHREQWSFWTTLAHQS